MISSIIHIAVVILIGVLGILFIFKLMKEMGFFKKNKKQEPYDSMEENIMDESLSHPSEEYYKFELKTELTENREDILINIPEICPICNQYTIEGYFNYKLKKNKYIKIPLCKEHYMKVRQKSGLLNRKIDIILLLVFVLTLIIGILIYLITQNSSFFNLILVVDSIPLFIYFFNNLFEKASYNFYIGKINKFVRMEYSKDSLVIIIKNSNWAKEFRSLNNWKEVQYTSKRIRAHREMGVFWVKILGLWALLSIPIIIISIIYLPIYAKLIAYFSVLIPIFLILMIWIFHILAEQALKTQPLSLSKKLVLIILALILFIIITLNYFGIVTFF